MVEGLDGVSKDLQISTVYCDTQSAIFLTNDHMFHERANHIDVRYYFVHEVIARCDIIMSNVDTKENPTNMMTKPFIIVKFEHCLNLDGICHGLTPTGACVEDE